MEAGKAASDLEVTAFVNGLLTQMRSRFDTMSDSILTKMDAMGNTIDELEAQVATLVDQPSKEAPVAAPRPSVQGKH